MIIQRKRKHNIGDIPVTITFKERDHAVRTETELGSILVNSTIKEREQTKEAKVRYISVNSAGQYQAKEKETQMLVMVIQSKERSYGQLTVVSFGPKACTYAYSVSFHRESALRHSKHEA